jgi:hypothetical protein
VLRNIAHRSYQIKKQKAGGKIHEKEHSRVCTCPVDGAGCSDRLRYNARRV